MLLLADEEEDDNLLLATDRMSEASSLPNILTANWKTPIPRIIFTLWDYGPHCCIPRETDEICSVIQAQQYNL